MTNNGKIVFISACLLLTGVGISSTWINYQANATTRASLQQTGIAQDKLRARMQFLRKETEIQKTRLSKLTKASDSPKETAPAENQASSGVDDRSAENPELARLRTRFFIADTTLAYGRFFQSLALSPAQLTQLSETIARFSEWSQDHANRWPRNVPPSDPRFMEFQSEADEQGPKYKSDLTAILGVEGVASFSEFAASQNLWIQVGNLASAVYASDTPLTADQSSQLVQVMKKDTTVATASSRSRMDLDAVLREATLILSPLQLSIFSKQLTAGKLWDAL